MGLHDVAYVNKKLREAESDVNGADMWLYCTYVCGI